MRTVEQELSALKIEADALRLCASNYEKAIASQRALTTAAEKRERAAVRKLERLIKLVQHNAKNASTILTQLENPK